MRDSEKKREKRAIFIHFIFFFLLYSTLSITKKSAICRRRVLHTKHCVRRHFSIDFVRKYCRISIGFSSIGKWANSLEMRNFRILWKQPDLFKNSLDDYWSGVRKMWVFSVKSLRFAERTAKILNFKFQIIKIPDNLSNVNQLTCLVKQFLREQQDLAVKVEKVQENQKNLSDFVKEKLTVRRIWFN